MHRTMLQVYVKESDKALPFYQKALCADLIASYPYPDGTIEHSELNVHGQIFAVSELKDDVAITGNTMQFCLHFGEGKESLVQQIADGLKDLAQMAECINADWSPLVWDIIDKYGVHWCIFV